MTPLAALKMILAGVAGAIIGAVLWVTVAFVLPIAVPYLASRITGSGGIAGASIGSDSILIAALVGFSIGLYWMFRRSSVRR